MNIEKPELDDCISALTHLKDDIDSVIGLISIGNVVNDPDMDSMNAIRIKNTLIVFGEEEAMLCEQVLKRNRKSFVR